jgi:hypothetical protein
MTNLQKIKDMDIDTLAAWLDENGMFDNSPWTNWFAKKYCDNCESIEVAYTDAKEKLGLDPFYDESFECAFCELADECGVKKCRFFPDLDDIPDNKKVIKMWLEEPANED